MWSNKSKGHILFKRSLNKGRAVNNCNAQAIVTKNGSNKVRNVENIFKERLSWAMESRQHYFESTGQA